MFNCGLSVALCRLALAAFDVTTGIVKIGGLISEPFRERLGVREGGVESPWQFCIYISELRQRLEQQHPNLCKLLHITFSVLLFADDAALVAYCV